MSNGTMALVVNGVPVWTEVFDIPECGRCGTRASFELPKVEHRGSALTLFGDQIRVPVPKDWSWIAVGDFKARVCGECSAAVLTAFKAALALEGSPRERLPQGVVWFDEPLTLSAYAARYRETADKLRWSPSFLVVRPPVEFTADRILKRIQEDPMLLEARGQMPPGCRMVSLFVAAPGPDERWGLAP